MKQLVFVCLLLVIGSVSNVSGDVPRHMDPELYELSEPDPDYLFMLYHNVYEGMILENMTVSQEWLDYAAEMYSVDELNIMLDEYRGDLEIQAENLNLTRYHLDLAIQYIGQYNLSGARSSFFTGLSYLQDSNETIHVLRNSTHELGAVLGKNPEILLNDVDRLESLVGGYRDFAQILANYVSGEEISDEDLDVIREKFKDVLDPELLDEVEKYLDDLGGGVNLGNLIRTGLSMSLNGSNVWVGDGLQVSGRLMGGDVGLEGRRILLKLGNNSWITFTDRDGYYSKVISVPYIYKQSVEIRGFYWPTETDSETYSPATISRRLVLLYCIPFLELDYEMGSFPGRVWNISGRLSFDDTGLEGHHIVVTGFGRKRKALTGGDGYFELGIGLPFDQSLGRSQVYVSSLGLGVYAGVDECLNVSVSRLKLSLITEAPRFVFSGFGASMRYTVSAGGAGLNGCRVRVSGRDDVGLDYSQSGSGSVRLYVPLWRLGGDYGWRLVAEPDEPWINDGVVSGSFYVVNTVVIMFSLGLLGTGGVYLKRYLNSRSGDTESLDEPVLKPVSMPVSESAMTKGGFGGLFLAALRFVEALTGVSMKPSDTLREYLSRVLDGLGDRMGGLFSELVSRYERWLYDKPYEAELDEVEVLVAGLKEDED